MACNTQISPSIVVKEVEHLCRRRITQADWHESRNLAKDLGLNTSKAKADPLEASTVFMDFVYSLSSPEDADIVKEKCTKFVLGRPTEGTLAIMRLYRERGVAKTLAVLQAERRSEKVAEDLYPEGTRGFVFKRADYKKHVRMFFDAKRNHDGIFVWQANGQVPPTDVVTHWQKAELITPEEARAANELREQQLVEAIEQYKHAMQNRTPEEASEQAAEARAAFGPGQEVVDILTGERFTT